MKSLLKYFAVILTLNTLILTLGLSQVESEPDVICIKGYYEGYGVIFPSGFIPEIQSNENVGKGRFSPSIKQIKRAEEILFEQYNKVHSEDTRVINFSPIKDVEKHFNKWYRQYIGYVAENGNLLLEVQLLNFSKKRKAERNFEGWEEKYFVGADGFYSKNLLRFKVNLNEGKLILP